MRSRTVPTFAAAAVALSLALPGTALARIVPHLINQEGLVLDRQQFPVDEDDVPLTFRIYLQEAGGQAPWEENHVTNIVSGYYNVLLGSVVPMTPAVLDHDELWLEVQYKNENPMRPRHRLVSLPFAVHAHVSENAVGDLTPRTVTASGAHLAMKMTASTR